MTVTNDGVALNEQILIRTRGEILRVPAGYLSPWPTKNMRNRMNEQKGIAFNFWMPDRRYVEIYPFSMVGFRPRERGRAPPAPDAYVVKVLSLESIKADDPDYLSPEKAFKNSTSIPGISSYSFQQEDFGLVRFWRHDGPHPQPQALIRYRHMEGTDPQVLLRCRVPPHGKPEVLPYPSCDGSVHFVADDLGFYLQFDRKNLPQWRAIVNAVRDLYVSWKAATDLEHFGRIPYAPGTSNNLDGTVTPTFLDRKIMGSEAKCFVAGTVILMANGADKTIQRRTACEWRA